MAEQAGHGIEGKIDGSRITVGSPRWLDAGVLGDQVAGLEEQGMSAVANTLPEALKKAYAATESIHFDKLHKRSDIGARALAAMQ